MRHWRYQYENNDMYINGKLVEYNEGEVEKDRLYNSQIFHLEA